LSEKAATISETRQATTTDCVERAVKTQYQAGQARIRNAMIPLMTLNGDSFSVGIGSEAGAPHTGQWVIVAEKY
jgi:hypothetical protein